MKKTTVFAFFVSCILALSLSPAAYGETTTCTSIASLPYTISTSGIYCLKANKSINNATAPAITINADNVTIDLNGFELKRTGTSHYAILSDGHSNLTIRNGTINGFATGNSAIRLDVGGSTAKNFLLEDLKVINSGAITLGGAGNHMVRNNQIMNDAIYSNGNIEFYGSAGINNAAINNSIANTLYGIYASSGMSVRIENNRIENAPELIQNTRGIEIEQANTSAIIVNNRISNMAIGIYHEGKGYYRDNILMDCTAPYETSANVIDAGNNKP